MLKEKFERLNDISLAVGRFFARFPFPPNFYSWATLVPAAVGMMLIMHGWTIAGVVLFVIAGCMDMIDGGLARATGKQSNLGAFIDGSLDRFVDLMLLFSYFFVPLKTVWFPVGQWICLMCFFMIMPSFEVAYANHRRAVPDPTEKVIWRILHRSEMYPLMLVIPLVAIKSSVIAGYILVGLVILSAITTIQTILETIIYSKRY